MDGCPDCPHAGALYDLHVHGRADLGGPWLGWRVAGRYLIAPDRTRISREELEYLLLRAEMQRWHARLCRERQKAGHQGAAVVVPLRLSPSRPSRPD